MGIYSSIGGKVLTRYEVGPLIGNGAMGHVYRALDVRLNRPVAIKVLPHWARGDSKARARLRREALAASALNHPNIITIYDIDNEGGVDLMVMEYLAGKTLGELIPARGLPIAKVLDLAVPIVDALSAAHSANILHRDLKPSNIMVTEEGRLKVLDFGLAMVHTPGGKPSDVSDQAGTRVYMSPEQLKGFAAEPRSEIFSVGLVLFQMLTGRHPFGPGDRTELAAAIQSKDPARFPPKVPAVLAKVVYRCLEKVPELRFESMQQLLIALKQLSGVAGRGRLRSTAEPLAATSGSADVRQVHAITKRIGYKNIPHSRNALEELTRLIEDSSLSSQAHAAAMACLKDHILSLGNYDNGVPEPVREVRILVLNAMKAGAHGQLGRYFARRDLEQLDLYDMDFSGEILNNLSFHRCFLTESRFCGSNLSDASFSRAWIRNVDFTNANLSDVDFSNSDWFNAINLTAGQLARAQKATLMDCPASIEEMHHILGVRYGRHFDSWTRHVRDQLRAAWAEYLRPGGLRDVVAQWRHSG